MADFYDSEDMRRLTTPRPLHPAVAAQRAKLAKLYDHPDSAAIANRGNEPIRPASGYREVRRYDSADMDALRRRTYEAKRRGGR